MSIDKEKEYNDHYLNAYYAWNDFYGYAARDLEFYLGNQWDINEINQLLEQGRSHWVYNLIQKNINVIDGYQRQHRLSSIVVPQQEQDQQAADDLSDLLLYALQANDGYKNISDCFSGANKTGWNLCTLWMDYRDDPVNGDIKFGREPYSGFITDPYFTKLDLSDCSYVIRRKFLSPEQVISLLPEHQEEIWNLYYSGWSRDDKFTWLPYQTQAQTMPMMAYDEFYKQMWKKVDVLVDTNTGDMTEWEGPKDALKFLLKSYPQLQVIQKQKRYIECNTYVNNRFMKEEINPYGLDEYPFVPFVGLFQPEADVWSLKIQSLVRSCIDPQRQVNRRLSQMTDIVESQINSGWIVDKDSVVNPHSLYQSGQGKVIFKNPGTAPIEKIQAPQIPQSFFELTDVFAKGMSEILGINDAAFGIPNGGNESGLMMMIRQGATVTNLQHVMDNLRLCQKFLSQKIIKLIQTWTPQKVQKILGRQPSEQFYSKEFIKYDISIQEGPLSDSQRQIAFQQMLDLYQVTGGPQGSPITPAMLVKNAPLQNKSQINQEIEQNQQQAQQQAQQQQQIQQAVLQGQMENLKASSIEKVAGAKERYTRAFANTSLETERSARAVDDRASAALDRVKALKELQDMDLEAIIKGLTIIQGLENKAKSDEEKIRNEDLVISSQGNELGKALAGSPPGGQQ